MGVYTIDQYRGLKDIRLCQTLTRSLLVGGLGTESTSGSLAFIDELCAEIYLLHGPGDMNVKGLDGIWEMLRSSLAAFPDLDFTIEDQMAEGEKVAERFTGRGTHNGPLAGIGSTGESVTVVGVINSRLEGGKLVEDWESFDELGMMQQIGAGLTADCVRE